MFLLIKFLVHDNPKVIQYTFLYKDQEWEHRIWVKSNNSFKQDLMQKHNFVEIVATDLLARQIIAWKMKQTAGFALEKSVLHFSKCSPIKLY